MKRARALPLAPVLRRSRCVGLGVGLFYGFSLHAQPAPPTEQPPAEQPPTEQPPTEQPPAEQPPTKQPPTEQQLKLADELELEAQVFERGARAYQRHLNRIVQHHYGEHRRQVIDGLEKEIKIGREELTAARAEAIRRYEEFIAKYRGPKADPQATPDAMFRLAALYEERARQDSDADLQTSLKPAIALYQDIITDFPGYRELVGVHYYLGHALTDTGALDEAQQVFRAAVCHNQYTVKLNPEGNLLLQALPQDHSEAFWNDWFNRHPIPLDQLSTAEHRPRGKPRASASTPVSVAVRGEELEFVDPYTNCQALPQEIEEGEEPRYLAEMWWQIGNFHFDQLDAQAGPYAFNRAASAYQQSRAFKKPPLHGVALYKLAWTHFKQQRYAAAVEHFVELLRYADKQRKATGDEGADFRNEAYMYIAASLTYVDFQGPPAHHPFIPRSDALDVETDALVAERKMRVAITRVQDATLIPQDQPWSVEIYKALAKEYVDIPQARNAIETMELAIQRFPKDRDAPVLQYRIAELFDEMANLAPPGSPLREEATSHALAARTELARYVGETAWTRANADNPEALRTAERLVRQGLQQVAADRTNAARALVARAKELDDPNVRRVFLEQAASDYRMAAVGWGAYIDQDPNAPDVYESRFWLTDARFWQISLELELGRTPAEKDVARALEAAAAVRDSNEDDRFLQPAAYYAVAIADRVLEARQRDFQTSGGARGVKKRDEVEFTGTGLERQVVHATIPTEVLATVYARDDYNRRIPLGSDPEKNGLLYAFQAAEQFFVYGHFEEARARLEPMHGEYCGKNEWGYKAWERLVSMSNFEGDADRSRALIEGQSCAYNEETRLAEEAIRVPVRSGVAYLDARRVYDAAEKLPEGPERDAKWREAAAAYNTALDAAPDRDEAPEAAMNGAYAYKQVGEYDRAIGMYELFISRYGTEQKLRELQQGDPTQDPPVEPDPARYAARVKFLKMAYDALANAYVLFFDYPKAAEAFKRIGSIGHFPLEERREAARQAISLYSSLGDESAMARTHAELVGMQASRGDTAEADFLVASASLKLWDPLSPDTGGNAQARARAEAALEKYFNQNRTNPPAAPYVVEAAYWVAKAKAATETPTPSARQWWQNTVDAFEVYRQVAPVNPDGSSSVLGSRQASMAAEGAYTLLDQDIQKAFDHESGRERFKGTPQEVLTAYRQAATAAKLWFDRLQGIIDAYASPEWGTAAIARQGMIYDALRSSLYNTRPPDLQMFDKKTEALLRKAEESDNLELQEKADALRIRVESAWQETRDLELTGADQVLVDRYARAIAMARRYNVTNPAIVRAIQRLAFFTELLGEATIQSHALRVPEIQYREGLFIRMRPGLVTAPDPSGLAPASPKAAGSP